MLVYTKRGGITFSIYQNGNKNKILSRFNALLCRFDTDSKWWNYAELPGYVVYTSSFKLKKKQQKKTS